MVVQARWSRVHFGFLYSWCPHQPTFCLKILDKDVLLCFCPRCYSTLSLIKSYKLYQDWVKPTTLPLFCLAVWGQAHLWISRPQLVFKATTVDQSFSETWPFLISNLWEETGEGDNVLLWQTSFSRHRSPLSCLSKWPCSSLHYKSFLLDDSKVM